jgi:hypothetical protein
VLRRSPLFDVRQQVVVMRADGLDDWVHIGF